MANVSFFTEESSITTNQIASEAFGPLPDSGNSENYNLENRFAVSADAPAYAITKGLLIAIANSENVNLLNLILLPINGTTAGFPIKFFIYRGIRKTSLINSNDTIPVADATWASDNILKIIKDLQDKKNIEDNTPGVIATSDSLGYQFSTLQNDTLIEKFFFNNNQGFQPLIVNTGCQIGKFNGSSNLAGIEVVLDMIGNEPELEIAKKSTHLFSIPKVNINDPGLTSKQQLEVSFKNRYQKEAILAYVDIAAFYGACKSQKTSVSGLSSSVYLQKFYNKNVIYIDIRDDYGFSFNHFFKFQDTIWSAVNPSGNTPADNEYSTIDYYEKWPIFQLRDLQFSNNKSNIWLKLPLSKLNSDVPFFCGCLTAKFYSNSNIKETPFQIIANDPQSDRTSSISSNPLRFSCWKHDDGKAGANYFLLSQSYPYNPLAENTSKIWHNFFSLAMTNIFDDITLDHGEFAVKCYSTLSAPLIKDIRGGSVFSSVIGLSVDKEHFTFFSYKEDLVYSQYEEDTFIPTPLLSTGLYNYNYDTDDYDFTNIPAPNVGFLAMLSDGLLEKNYSLVNLTTAGSGTNLQALNYAKAGEFIAMDDVFESIEIISLNKEEYNLIKTVYSADFPDHPTFIKSINFSVLKTMNYNIEQTDITVSFPVIVEDVENAILYVELQATPNPILLNGQPISFTSINYK